jgi:hypothetical protein
MAELRDWLNQKVLYIDLCGEGTDSPIGDLRFVFQKNIFIDNVVGWRDEIQAEIKLYKFLFCGEGINEFVTAAKHWLALPLNVLGSTFFSGKWSLGTGGNNQLDLEFERYYSTPSKTDWFNVKIAISSEVINWSENLHVDYTCLALFIEGLSACPRPEFFDKKAITENESNLK